MTERTWRQTSAVFDDRAAEYDAWFDNSLLFEIELATLRQLVTRCAPPRLEIGVGPGRFAQALAVDYGIDPAFAPLRIAKGRGIEVAQGVGESLPVAAARVATVYLLFTLCFLADPHRVLGECHRILKPGGHLVLGFVPAEGTWGRALMAKKEKNHPFYQHARFYKAGQVIDWLQQAGFAVVEERSSLFQDPGALAGLEESRPGRDERAGFCLLVGRK